MLALKNHDVEYMTQKVVRRLGVRLSHLFQWVGSAQPYDNIWDLCCDHGRLGLHLHERHLDTHVTLVDKVGVIVDQLRADYQGLADNRLHFKTADVCQLKIATESRTLLIIAGVGGENLISMLDGILTRLADGSELDCILSPNSHMFELRAFLGARRFTLIDEAFVTEKTFSHEHLWLRYKASQYTEDCDHVTFDEVSPVGNRLWLDMTEAKRRYITKLIHHYQRILKSRDSIVAEQALKAYCSLL